ncbi:hypothetical protein MA16_Dca009097 [Dendrobium catenatum]|uniref:Uncharacterized protein n=1 Tax=Dendrobium catenatum TaxID=906689 RepID=A0A2I0VRI3_9ASPA|nr:hypothetical protein MA16_Dca009097 [Dendrobium catenatum]
MAAVFFMPGMILVAVVVAPWFRAAPLSPAAAASVPGFGMFSEKIGGDFCANGASVLVEINVMWLLAFPYLAYKYGKIL